MPQERRGLEVALRSRLSEVQVTELLVSGRTTSFQPASTQKPILGGRRDLCALDADPLVGRLQQGGTALQSAQSGCRDRHVIFALWSWENVSQIIIAWQ